MARSGVCIAVLLCAAFLGLASAQTAGERRWCTTSSQETAFCRTVVAEFQSNDPGGNTWSCVQVADDEACITALQNRQVDYWIMVPVYLYDAIPLGVRVIGYEEYPTGAAAYYAVAIVRKEDCDRNPALTIADYRGKASCHTGYRRTAGWNMPIGHYVSTGAMTPVNRDPALNNDIETVQNFFSKSCAIPQAGSPAGSPHICTLCPGESCVASNASKYWDYDGVLYCVEKGGGDIGFTKHDVLGNFAAGQPKAKEWAEAPVGEFRILCPNGGCTTFNDFQRCNTVTVPSRAIVTYAEATPAAIGEFQTILAALNSDPQFVDLVMRGTNRQSYMFNADTIRLNPYNGTSQAYMEVAFEAYRSMEAMETNTALTAGAFSVTSGFAMYGVVASAVAVVVALF